MERRKFLYPNNVKREPILLGIIESRPSMIQPY